MKSIYPILGVLLGWLLNEISYSFRLRSEDKKELKCSIMQLLSLYNSIVAINVSLKKAANYKKELDKDFSEMEERRLRNIKLLIVDMNEIVDEIKGVKEKIARFSPIIGNKVSEIADFVKGFNNIKLEETSKIPELYIDQLINFEVSFNLLEERIKEIIIKLALKISPVFYFKIKKHLEKRKQQGSFLDELDKDSLENYYSFREKIGSKNNLNTSFDLLKKFYSGDDK